MDSFSQFHLLSCGQKGDQGCDGAEVQGGRAPTPGWGRVPATPRWDERAHMKWTRTAFKDPSQRYSACIYNDDHVLSGWVVIWVDEYRQYDCLGSQMDLPHTVLVSSCWSRPTLWRCRATVFFRMFRCILLSPLSRLWSPLLEWIWTVDGSVVDTSILTDIDSDGTGLPDFWAVWEDECSWLRERRSRSVTHTPTASGASLWASPIKSTYHCIDPLTGTSGHTRQSCRDVFQLYRKHA